MAAAKTPEFTEAAINDGDVVTAEVEVFSSIDNAQKVVESFGRQGAGVHSTFELKTFADRVKVVQAMTQSKPLAENTGVVIDLRNFILQATEVRNRQTDQMEPAVRATLVDDQGNSYHAMSVGVVTSLRNFVGVLGEPSTWPEALPVVASKVKASKGDVLTLTVA